jgi:hypothetical protein
MVPGGAVFDRLGLPEDDDLLKSERLNAQLFLKLTSKRINRRFICFTVPSNDIPDTG